MNVIRTLIAVATAAVSDGQTLTVLYNFSTHGGGGYEPLYGVTVGPEGQLYGITALGGASGLGAAYELIPPTTQGAPWTHKVIHSFSSTNGDGQAIGAPLLGPDGILYGSTGNTETSGGTVYKLTPPKTAGSRWAERVLYTFSVDGPGGEIPWGLTFGPDHSLYGWTGGGTDSPYGAAFQLTPPAPPQTSWSQSVIYNFPAVKNGSDPDGSAVIGSDGSLYFASPNGGALGNGGIFQLVPPASLGGPWTENVLYSFTGTNGDGYDPIAGLTLGPNGVLYGTTKYGGYPNPNCGRIGPSPGCGTVFQLTPPTESGGAWTETILYSFQGPGTDGSQPNSVLVPGPNGVLYGTTASGGVPNSNSGLGTIFELVPPSTPGGAWSEVLLYTFSGESELQGDLPNGVALGADGALYGTTEGGGTYGKGVVFQFMP